MELRVGGEAGVGVLEDAVDDPLEVVGQLPHVLFRSLGLGGGHGGHELVLLAKDDVVVRLDAPAVHDESSFLWAAARGEHDEDRCTDHSG